jgi:hypothetical protein
MRAADFGYNTTTANVGSHIAVNSAGATCALIGVISCTASSSIELPGNKWETPELLGGK